MKIQFDPAKSARNILERGLPFELAYDFDFSTATVVEDTRKSYPGRRWIATGYIGQRLFIICFTPVRDGLRIISLRKANHREVVKHGKKTTD